METRRSAYYESLTGDVKLRYEQKIESCGNIDPYTLKESDLSKNRNEFPEISWLDIGNHMIHSVSPFTKRAFKAYKSMEAYSFFESGFVTNVGLKKNEESAIIVGKTSVTEMLCKWNVPKFKEDSMSLAKDMKWTSASYEESTIPSKKFESTFMKSCDELTAFSDDTITEFIKSMPGKISAMHTVLFPNDKRRNSSLKDEIFLSSWYDVQNKEKSHFELVEMGTLRQIRLSDNDLKEISHLTICKHTAKKFSVALRRGRITGSKFKECHLADIGNPSTTIVNSLIHVTENSDNIPSVKYQTRNKAKAIKQYIGECLETHENFKYEECGLIMNPKFPFFAASADGLVSCDCHGRACVEIKCIKISGLDESLDVLTRKPTNILRKDGSEYFLDESHAYFYKSQMQIYLAETESCDLAIWSPESFRIIRIDADSFFWNEAKQKAQDFHQEVMMPELLGKFYTQKKGEENLENIEEYLEEISTLMELEGDKNYLEVVRLEIDILE